MKEVTKRDVPLPSNLGPLYPVCSHIMGKLAVPKTITCADKGSRLGLQVAVRIWSVGLIFYVDRIFC